MKAHRLVHVDGSGRRRVLWGEVAHTVAAPVARVVDAALGTRLGQCRGCAERRRRWNGGVEQREDLS